MRRETVHLVRQAVSEADVHMCWSINAPRGMHR